jgi:hypothetical protein
VVVLVVRLGLTWSARDMRCAVRFGCESTARMSRAFVWLALQIGRMRHRASAVERGVT